MKWFLCFTWNFFKNFVLRFWVLKCRENQIKLKCVAKLDNLFEGSFEEPICQPGSDMLQMAKWLEFSWWPPGRWGRGGGRVGTNLCLLNWILNGGLILIEMGLLEKHLNGGTSLLPLKKSEKIENYVTKINE